MAEQIGRAALIAQTNAEFPTHWHAFRACNGFRPPEYTDPPVLVALQVGSLTPKDTILETEIVARFKKADGTEYELRGLYIDTPLAAQVSFTFTEEEFVDWGTVEENICAYLIGTLLHGSLSYQYVGWSELPE